MDYRAAFATALERVRAEGRYRVFADLKRHRGEFPKATWTRGDGATAEGLYALFDRLGGGGKDFSAILELFRGKAPSA